MPQPGEWQGQLDTENDSGTTQLVWRSPELEAVTALLRGAHEEKGGALVILGEHRVGKTALLNAAAGGAVRSGFRILRVTAVESEASLGYASLHTLLLKLPEFVERLPAPQRGALQGTLGMVTGDPPNPLLVGLAILRLLSEVASEAPLLYVIDDAQWLDRKSAVVLGFVARRLCAKRAFLLFALPALDETTASLEDIPQLVMPALDADRALSPVSSVAPNRLHPLGTLRLADEAKVNLQTLKEFASTEPTGCQFDGYVPLQNRPVVSPPALLPGALSDLVHSHIRRGQFDEAEAMCTEAHQLAEATGAFGWLEALSLTRLLLLCWRGREEEARALAAELALKPCPPSAEPWRIAESVVAAVPQHLAVLNLALGRYREVLDELCPVLDDDLLRPGTVALAEVVEAAVRLNELVVAREALDQLEARAGPGGGDWGLGLVARCQALLAPNATAEQLYRRAIGLLTATTARTEVARSHLLFGEWLRRQRRRREARVELAEAYELFVGIGARAFAERARVELRAPAATARTRSVDTREVLTPQESQVARLVAEGNTNREVAAQLFISPATVDYHLRKVYQKYGIKSRVQLANLAVKSLDHGSYLGGYSRPGPLPHAPEIASSFASWAVS